MSSPGSDTLPPAKEGGVCRTSLWRCAGRCVRSSRPDTVPHPAERQTDRGDDHDAEDPLESDLADQVRRVRAEEVRDEYVTPDSGVPATATPARHDCDEYEQPDVFADHVRNLTGFLSASLDARADPRRDEPTDGVDRPELDF